MTAKRRLPFVPHGDPPDPRWADLVILPTDYTAYGGDVERWADPRLAYPDCSCGCAWFDAEDADWGVCRKPGAPREGLLTWEHQAGQGCYEYLGRLAARVEAESAVVEAARAWRAVWQRGEEGHAAIVAFDAAVAALDAATQQE